MRYVHQVLGHHHHTNNISDDTRLQVVNWEVDRSSESRPKWYRSGKEAERLLNNSDPGQRYAAPVNVAGLDPN